MMLAEMLLSSARARTRLENSRDLQAKCRDDNIDKLHPTILRPTHTDTRLARHNRSSHQSSNPSQQRKLRKHEARSMKAVLHRPDATHMLILLRRNDMQYRIYDRARRLSPHSLAPPFPTARTEVGATLTPMRTNVWLALTLRVCGWPDTKTVTKRPIEMSEMTVRTLSVPTMMLGASMRGVQVEFRERFRMLIGEGRRWSSMPLSLSYGRNECGGGESR